MADTEAGEFKVRVRNLCKSFGDLEVLRNCTFDVGKEEFVCVVGPTGCGKTTFLNLLTCLIEPSGGEILLDGKRANPKDHNIAFVFQEPSAFPWLTVEKNVRYGLEIKKNPKAYIDERVDTVIGLLGLEKYRHAYPGQLSVSTEQKIVIGRAFAMNPDLLLMDEPYGQMDVKTRFYLEDEVIRLWKELGSTVIFITHNIEEAVYLAQRILVLSQKPASIKESLDLSDMPYPRDIASEKFVEIRTRVTDLIKWW
jgi:sulfonate transport system ATP-binding protein